MALTKDDVMKALSELRRRDRREFRRVVFEATMRLHVDLRRAGVEVETEYTSQMCER